MSSVKELILIVEDEPANQATLRARLEANGYEVLCADDGEEGLLLARRENPNLIILDMKLPNLDGCRVSSLLKRDERYRDIPILMLTARVGGEEHARALTAGVDVYMTKPFDSVILMDTIRRLLEQR